MSSFRQHQGKAILDTEKYRRENDDLHKLHRKYEIRLKEMEETLTMTGQQEKLN